ncbi:MAG: hypothetical protein VB018_09395 [Lachnospiraceae bacterium]|nr:hypothetical protein [Lachnospiraceae bacterium]
MAKQKSGDVVESEVTEPKFTKAQLMGSKKHTDNRDLLNALLTEGESYSHSEVTKLIEDFMKGEIK